MLKKIADAELIARVQNELDEDSLLELIGRHTGICLKMYHKFSAKLNSVGLSEKDIIENIPFIIFTAIKLFKFEKKVKLVSWIGNQMAYYIMREIQKAKKKAAISLENMSVEPSVKPENIHTVEDYIHKIKNAKIRQILELRCLEPRKTSWKNIGAQLGIGPKELKECYSEGIKMVSKEFSDFA